MNNLQKIWKAAAEDLNLLVEIPFNFKLADGKSLNIDVRLHDFGAKNGMLIVNNFDFIKAHIGEIEEYGFGFSVMSSAERDFDKMTIVDLLQDWSWAGDQSNQPNWLF